jgi:hypothetical protein
LLQIFIRWTISMTMLSFFAHDASLSVTFLTGGDLPSFIDPVWRNHSITRGFVAVCHISDSLRISFSLPGPEFFDCGFVQKTSDRVKSNRLVATGGRESLPRRYFAADECFDALSAVVMTTWQRGDMRSSKIS